MNVLMIGTGEYTTGYVDGSATSSDKRAGVVALTLFDLRRRGLIDRIALAGTQGSKFPGIRQHLAVAVQQVYRDMDIALDCFPDDGVVNALAYRDALATMAPGDVVTIFTPDDTHFPLAMDAIAQGCHVLVAKPLVKSSAEHEALARAAREAGVLVAVEVHKRWDPIYQDARDRIRQLGDFSYFHSYMSQPKSQLTTFRRWAGRASDISYYLNTHHIDFHDWALGEQAEPITVMASSATGWAHGMGIPTEDTIVLQVGWRNRSSGNLGTAIYTASWIAPRSDVHSQQRFFYMGQLGEIAVDQAHRGYTQATDVQGLAAINPLFMKYTPDAQRYFAGQSGYGYRSIEAFVQAAQSIREGRASPADFDGTLATVQTTTRVTQILEAGRISLDTGTVQSLASSTPQK